MVSHEHSSSQQNFQESASSHGLAQPASPNFGMPSEHFRFSFTFCSHFARACSWLDLAFHLNFVSWGRQQHGIQIGAWYPTFFLQVPGISLLHPVDLCWRFLFNPHHPLIGKEGPLSPLLKEGADLPVFRGPLCSAEDVLPIFKSVLFGLI